MMRKGFIIAFISLLVGIGTISAQTLVIYYSFSGHCREITTSLTQQITADVLEAHADEIFDEAENRLHAQKAVMVKLMGEQT